MIRRLVTPLVGAATLVACGGKAPPDGPARPPGPPTVAVSLADVGLEAGALDRTADPCGDFFQFACGGWLAANPIPPDRARWGRLGELGERNLAAERAILDEAAAAPTDPVTQQLGDYYASCLDTAAIEQRGLDGVKPLLDYIAKAKDARGLGAAVTALHRAQIAALWTYGAEADNRDARAAILVLDAGGLGLPDRDYYLSDELAPRARRTGARSSRCSACWGGPPRRRGRAPPMCWRSRPRSPTSRAARSSAATTPRCITR
jgi:putative endopeptidase